MNQHIFVCLSSEASEQSQRSDMATKDGVCWELVLGLPSSVIFLSSFPVFGETQHKTMPRNPFSPNYVPKLIIWSFARDLRGGGFVFGFYKKKKVDKTHERLVNSGTQSKMGQSRPGQRRSHPSQPTRTPKPPTRASDTAPELLKRGQGPHASPRLGMRS